MSENLSDLAGKLIINGVQIKKLLIDGSIIFDKDGEHSEELIIQGYKIKRLVLNGISLFYEGFKQKWINENPANSQIGKIPLDQVGAKHGIIESSIRKTFEHTDAGRDTVSSKNGFSDANLINTFKYKEAGVEEVSARIGFISATLVDVNS